MNTNLFDGPSSETDYDSTSFPGNTFQRICQVKLQFSRLQWITVESGSSTIYQTNRVINDINAFLIGQTQHLLLPTGLGVINSMICTTQSFRNFHFLRWTCCSNNFGAQCYADLCVSFSSTQIRAQKNPLQFVQQLSRHHLQLRLLRPIHLR